MKGILLAGLLSACQNENDIKLAPQAPTGESDQNARTALAVGKLIKDGQVDLSYQGSGVLSQETYPNVYYQFTYNPQLITAKRYVNGSPTEYKYTLDMNGRCIETVTDKTYIYEYDVYGQLTRLYNKNQPNEQTVFTYNTVNATNSDRSLATATFYNAQNVKTKALTFGYGGNMAIPDKHPLNPDVLPAGVSKYLPIFGKFSSNLVQSIYEYKYLLNGQQESITQYTYSYKLNYAGKATNIIVKKYSSQGYVPVSSTDRKYFTPSF
ncbi:hypothetical protein Dfer_4519 [Dyadobacter fermentans DSM 18053]|uniref:Uncharacterized protein n=2 Tax=Dyadobacter fermentans TaxID=94254 RepID=C6W307_DYAFD|nr:hypothetical protein Dfer_4519 [Dyadobacter fermentans DSM 18053]